MKLRKPFSLFIQIIMFVPWLWGAAEAKSTPCNDLVNPLHRQVNVVQDRAGMWSLFEKLPKLQNHSALALKLDSKILGLMFTLDYLCETQKGIPYSDIAEYIVRQMKEFGEEGFIEKNEKLGHTQEEVAEWAEFGRFSMKNHTRKLDFNQIKKTVEQAKSPVERYELLFKNREPASAVIAKAKVLIEDIKKLHATDPYLKQADYENSQVPHSSDLANSGDAM